MTHLSNDPEVDHRGSGVSAAQVLRVLPAIVVLVALLAFALANTQETEVHLVFTTVRAPLFLVLLLTALAGVVLAALLRLRARSD